MAYATGTANDLDELITIIRNFVEARGWTINRHVVGAAIDSELIMTEPGGTVFTMKAQVTTGNQWYRGGYGAFTQHGLKIYGATGFSAGAAWDAQPGLTFGYGYVNWLNGPYVSYHLFGDTYYVHCVVEVGTNEYRHLVFGTLNRYGTWAGGGYFAGVYWNHQNSYIDNPDDGRHHVMFDYTANNLCIAESFVRADLDGNQWYRIDSRSDSFNRNGKGAWRNQGTMSWIMNALPNTMNGAVLINPIDIWLRRPGNLWSPVGQVPDMRVIHMQGIAPGSEITYGTDTWMAFPVLVARDPSIRDDLPNSGWYGYAYRKF